MHEEEEADQDAYMDHQPAMMQGLSHKEAALQAQFTRYKELISGIEDDLDESQMIELFRLCGEADDHQEQASSSERRY